MEQEKNHYLDKKLFVSLLEILEPIIENKDRSKEDIKLINNKLNEFYLEIDKKQLITKYIQIVGEDIFNKLKVSSLESFFEILPGVLKASSLYINKTNDYLYLIAQLTIMTDWFLYKSIDIN